MEKGREDEEQEEVRAYFLEGAPERHLACGFRFSRECCDFCEGITVPEPKDHHLALFGGELLQRLSHFLDLERRIGVARDIRIRTQVPDIFDRLHRFHTSEVINDEIPGNPAKPCAE